MQIRLSPALLVVMLAILSVFARAPQSRRLQNRPPNIVIIFADDLGYADIGSFGATDYRTPNLDRMAAEGIRMTDFYAAQAVCSASRAALLTGCYPNRIGIRGALDHKSGYGLNRDEMTFAELVKQRGYATAMFGKWHLGHHSQFLPTRHGFDEYFGLPYSNDMWPRHPLNPNYYPDLPLIENERTIRLDPDQTQLTTRYTERSIAFIEKNKDRPFLLYLAHSMPHVPLFVSDKFKRKTKRGLFGDVIEELDWSVGQVLEALKRHNLDAQTLVIFTSDNGPWLSYGDHAGSAKPLREGKGTAFDGGVREPFIARWPGRIPAGAVSRTPAMTIDILPTIARLTGASLPKNRIIDGRDIWPVISAQKGAKEPHDALYFYWVGEMHAVRSGKWKLHLPHNYRSIVSSGAEGKPGRDGVGTIGLSLFDLENDIGETTDVSDKNPQVVRRLMTFVERARDDLGDDLTKRSGKNIRPAERME